MKTKLSLLILSLLTLSCDHSADEVKNSDAIVGFWSRQSVYLNGVNSNEHADFLNGGTNHLHIRKDNTFGRAYDNGTWLLSDGMLVLDRIESGGFADWTYKIVHHLNDSLVLDTQLTEGEYCCDFPSFAEDEVITIREVYKKLE
ncbi:MAG TPA: hypothetical protein VD927_07815 [Chryseosolibacter sp.]|nr:hypothetical protein [Chryseosolibacter sp.]